MQSSLPRVEDGRMIEDGNRRPVFAQRLSGFPPLFPHLPSSIFHPQALATHERTYDLSTHASGQQKVVRQQATFIENADTITELKHFIQIRGDEEHRRDRK